MSSPLLEVKDLQVVVGEENKILLDGLNLTVNAGETHVLMGHNGAGKSTLMSALMGDPRYTVTRGQIIFRGQDITHETADVRARAGMFLSFQTPEEIPGITIEVPAANKVIIRGIDKQVVGQFAAEVRGKRPPEPYKGKGVRYSTEVIHLKAGKTGGKK